MYGSQSEESDWFGDSSAILGKVSHSKRIKGKSLLNKRRANRSKAAFLGHAVAHAHTLAVYPHVTGYKVDLALAVEF